MIFIYNFLLTILAIICLPIILIAFIVKPKFRAGFWQKLGFYKTELDKSKKTILIHAVSVGEVNAVENFVKELKNELQDYNIVVTTVTKTGQELAKKKFKEVADEITYFPYDFSFSVNSLLNTYKPEKIVIAETEIWPNFVNIASKKGIKTFIINGRISPSSYNGYKKASFFFKPVLAKYHLILMQSEDDATRIKNIGAKDDTVKVMGNLKFDIKPNLDENQIQEFNNQLKLNNNPLIIAGSTHAGEDEMILEAFKGLKNKYADAKLIIAPRHPERYEQVISLLNNFGMNFGKRTQNDNFENNEIILLDTIGELSKLYALSKFAFIGGSFSGTGGHNPLEANIWGKPVISGYSTFNFKDIYKILAEENATIIVNNQEELNNSFLKMFDDEEFYNNACNSCKTVFAKNSGAVKRAVEEIKNN